MIMSSEDDPKKLRAENKKLQKELKELAIEKNLMEDRMYRSFQQLLQSKKRRISTLEGQLKRLKGDDDGVVSSSADVDQEVHCETCQCNRPSKRQRLSEEANQGESKSSEVDANDSGSETDYDDDTDLDEEPASKSSSNNTSPSKSVKSGGEPEAEKCEEASTSSEAKPKISEGLTGPGNSKEVAAEQSQPKEVPPEILLNSSTSSDDMDKLMDELCS